MSGRQFTSCLCDRPIYFSSLRGAVSPVAREFSALLWWNLRHINAVPATYPTPTHTHTHKVEPHMPAHTGSPRGLWETRMSRLLLVLITGCSSFLGVSVYLPPPPPPLPPQRASTTTFHFCRRPSCTFKQAPRRLSEGGFTRGLFQAVINSQGSSAALGAARRWRRILSGQSFA